jgi:hypothetical protein
MVTVSFHFRNPELPTVTCMAVFRCCHVSLASEQSIQRTRRRYHSPILRCDAQDFRVLRLYIIKSSPVLKALMEATSSNPSVAAFISDAGTPLPVVEMSDRGVILSCLLIFIFPMLLTLPQTVEDTMELLSVAQSMK